MGAQPSSAAAAPCASSSNDPAAVTSANDADTSGTTEECTSPRDTLDGDYERVGTPERTDHVPTPADVPVDAATLPYASGSPSLPSPPTQMPPHAPSIVQTKPGGATKRPAPGLSSAPAKLPATTVSTASRPTGKIGVPMSLSKPPVAETTQHAMSASTPRCAPTGTPQSAPQPGVAVYCMTAAVVERPTVVTATYGTPTRSNNVAPQLQKLDFPWRWRRHMNPNAFFGGDPHLGQAKTLVVTLTYPNASQPDLEVKLHEFGGRWRQPQNVPAAILTFT